MRKILMLTHEQMARIKPYFPLAHGIERVDDRRVISGILYVIRNGLQWKDAPEAYGPHIGPRYPNTQAMPPAMRMSQFS